MVPRILQIYKPRISRFYKLRGEQLLHPEGTVDLHHTAAKILSLCDGQRRIQDIKTVMFEESGGFDVVVNSEINASFLELYDNKWIQEN